ncbi:hypothetical protein AB0N62_36940 [Streptomyces sp. NPDC093982]
MCEEFGNIWRVVWNTGLGSAPPVPAPWGVDELRAPGPPSWPTPSETTRG